MIAADLRATLRRLGLSQGEAAQMLAVPLSTLTNWLAERHTGNSRRIPAWLPRVLALLERHPEAIETLRRME